MRRIVIFTDDPGWHGRQLTEAFLKKGFHSDYISLTECYLQTDSSFSIVIPGYVQSLPDAVFVRGIPGGSLEEVVFYLDILHALKKLGVPVYNDGRAIEASVDKAMTSFLLQQDNIQTPGTWCVRNRETALQIAEEQLGYGKYLISKPLFGSQGEGIRRIEKPTDLMWLTSSNGIFYFQEFIECKGMEYADMRVFVVNDVAIAGMKRKGISWLNNVARGATCESIELTSAIADIAVKAVQAVGMDYAGVDIIENREGQLQVIEVNSVPAWKGLQSICPFNIADHLVADLINRHLNG